MTRARSDAGRARNLFPIQYNPETDSVEVRVASSKAPPLLWIPRRLVRAFCDQLHDLADDLDRTDREA